MAKNSATTPEEALKAHGVTKASDLPVRGWLHSRNYALNFVLSGKFRNGWPLGHVAEIAGEPHTGKTYLLLQALGAAQDAGGVALMDDCERALNPEFARSLRVDPDKLFYTTSQTVEDHHGMAESFVRAMIAKADKRVGVMGLDSIANLSTRHEMEVGMEKRDLSKPGLLHAFFRILAGEINKTQLAYIATNHVYDNVGDFFNPIETPGGRGIKFQASIRMMLFNPSRLKNSSGNFIGVAVQGQTIKNRFTPAWRKFKIVLPFFEPVSEYSGLIPQLMDLGVLDTTGGHNLVFQEEDTKIKAQKSDILKQDKSAEELMAKYPNILDVAEEAALDLKRLYTFEGAEEE